MSRALIVDDQPEVCDLLSKTLQSVGIDSLSLQQSDIAPEFLTEGKFDIFFLDLHMSGVDGISLLRQVRSQVTNRLTPVILLSDDLRPSAMSVAFEAGASFFLYKPLDKDRVLKLIRATMSSLEYKRRQTRRVPLKAPFRMKCGGDVVEGETINMSLTGVLLKSPKPIPIGSPVDLSLFVVPQMKPVVSAGSVVRLDHENRVGVRFSRLSDQESMRLQEVLLPMIPAE